MRIGIIGAGGIGGVIGGLLSYNGYDVTLVDQWEEHVKAIKKNGLIVETQNGSYTTYPRAISISELQEQKTFFNVSFIVVKSYDTEWATSLMKSYTDPDSGYFVDFQNGINDEKIASIVGKEKSVGSIITIGAGCYEPGKVIRTDNYPLGFKVGEHDGTISERLKALNNILCSVADSEITTDLWGERWSKLMVNCMANALAGLTGYSTSEVRTIPEVRRVGIQLGAEVVRVALALGYKLHSVAGVSPELVMDAANGKNIEIVENSLLEAARKGGPSGGPSFGQDVLKKRRTEIEFLNGYVSEKGKQMNIPTPFNNEIVNIVLGLGIGFDSDPAHIKKLINMLPY